MIKRIWIKDYSTWEDQETKLVDSSRTNLVARVKRFNHDIPEHPFLGNRYVIQKVMVDDALPNKST